MSIYYPYGESSYIYGLHQAGGEANMVEPDGQGKGWIVFTEKQDFHDSSVPVGHDQEQRRPFTYWADKGYGVLVRLNHGYHQMGTLPYMDDLESFKTWVVNFVTGSAGAHIWIIGNEMNLPIEWPRYHTEDNPHYNKVTDASPKRPKVEVITAQRYAKIFKTCRDAIRSIPGHNFDQVVMGGVAPWNKGMREQLDAWHKDNEGVEGVDKGKDKGYMFGRDTTGAPAYADVVKLGDWVEYYKDILDKIEPGNIDGIALHTYSRPYSGRDVVQLIIGQKKWVRDTSKQPPVDPPYDPPYDFMGDGNPAKDPECCHLHNGFQSYTDFLARTPEWAQGLPIYITEANRDETWPDVNDGWIQSAYKEINDWNNREGTAKIRALCLYRWYNETVKPGDKDFHLGKATNAIQDFKDATGPTLESEKGKSYRWDRLVAHPKFHERKKATEEAGFGWIWGPVPRTAGLMEAYADSPGGARFVQYFDKARMEINRPTNPSAITTGLLVTEMIEGKVQLGDTRFDTRLSADECVAGNPKGANLTTAPTYASFKGTQANPLPKIESDKTGTLVSLQLMKDGTTASLNDPPKDPNNQPIKFAHYITDNDNPQARTLAHNIPGVLHKYLTTTVNAVVDKITPPPANPDPRRWISLMGYPISEAYWAKVKVGDYEKTVLVQAFQRRVLTYTASNEAEYQVEMGNVGLHYLNWRYPDGQGETPSIAARKVGPMGASSLRLSSLRQSDDAESAARSLTAEQQTNVSVTIQNTGTSAWTSQGNRPHWLEAASEAVRAAWGIERVALPGVAQGAQVTVNVPVRVPDVQPGTYRIPLRVAQDGANKSGNFSVIDVTVQVGETPETTTFEGYIDVVSGAVIWGWAWDSNRPNTPIDVELSYQDFDADGQPILPFIPLATLRADLYREDLVRAHIGNGCHGFSFTPPDFLFNGKRRFIKATVNRGHTQLGVSNTSPSFTGEISTYSGRVVDRTGSGIAQATVTLTSNQAPPRHTLTDAGGYYSFANVRTGRGLNYTLTASSPFYDITPSARTFDSIIGNQPQAGSASTDFQGTIRWFKIYGKVQTVPEEAGVLVPDMEILLTGGPQPASTRTGPASGVDRGLYKFDAVKAGRDYTVQPSDANYNFFPPTMQVARLAGDQEMIFLAARKRHRLDVVVRDDSAAHLAIGGATVRLSGWETRTGTTASNGLYTFPDLRKGRPYTVEVTHKHFDFNPPTQATPSASGLNQDTTFTFNGKLHKHDITVLITDQTGFIPEGAGPHVLDVTLNVSGNSPFDPSVNFNASNQPAITRPTDQQSPRYTICQLPAGGNYTVTPTHDYFDFTPASRAVNDLSNPAAWTFEARRKKYPVSGYVKDVFGTPLVNVVVSSSAPLEVQASTNAEGYYSLPGGLYAGLAYHVRPTPLPGMSFDFPQEILLALLTGPREAVNFKGGYAISGRVLDRRSRGIPRVLLTLAKAGTTTLPPVTTDESTGDFQFKFLARGVHDYKVTPARDGMSFSDSSLTIHELTGNYTTANFTGGHTVSGQIVDEFATPPIAQLGVSVTLSGAAYNDSAETTGPAGQYRFELVPPGDNYVVTPTKEGFTFDSPSQAITNLQYHKPLAFKGGYSVSGRVTDHSGQGIAGVAVKLTRTLRGASSERNVTTDAAGRYSFNFLAATAHVGEVVHEAVYVVTAQKAGYRFHPLSPALDLLRGSRTADFTQLLEISGNVTCNGVPLTDVAIQLSGAGSAVASVGPDGRYSFILLPSKQSYKITPTHEKYVFTPDSQTINLTSADQTADFAARALCFISGSVSLGSFPLVNRQIELTVTSAGVQRGGLKPVAPAQVTETDKKGRYVFAFLPEEGASYTVAPARGEQTFKPESWTFSKLNGEHEADFEAEQAPPPFDEGGPAPV